MCAAGAWLRKRGKRNGERFVLPSHCESGHLSPEGCGLPHPWGCLLARGRATTTYCLLTGVGAPLCNTLQVTLLEQGVGLDISGGPFQPQPSCDSHERRRMLLGERQLSVAERESRQPAWRGFPGELCTTCAGSCLGENQVRS